MTAPAEIGWFRQQSRAIGTITPSANLIVERITQTILAEFPEVSGHYSRTPVFGSQDPFPGDYDWNGMLEAARLLGHAKVDVIVWNGSKGAAVGFKRDRELCARISELSGIPSMTSMTVLEDVLRARGAKRLGIVTPYGDAYQKKLMTGFEAAGFECVAEAHAGIADNLAYASVDDATITAMMEKVALSRPDAIATVCTNLPAAHLVARLEERLQLPIYDSVSIGVWGALRLMGVSTARAPRWGSLFADDIL
jgi:maleate isomerase